MFDYMNNDLLVRVYEWKTPIMVPIPEAACMQPLV